ncbi:50S ribosomal protein L17 [Candidatus Woesebacteria bacterium RBG_13_34_9]|uniref:50S ribosomal protein L17 n=1 Tax=Candidatus Woesebacteria bacterium RBG_13_34_9 TaxID=1802477 RepID=A0A1F7X576_9BACT|nr:MAG: 50S ribosomal protein L17 [Candidatus Woesebacteria bacterium RBG_13_34_9]
MKKRVFGRKFSRDRGSRKALFRSLIKALIEHDEIITTKARAKAIQGSIDEMMTLAGKEGLSAKKRLYSLLINDKRLVIKLLDKIKPAFVNKKSGFTRIVNLPQRLGDRAEIVRLEWSEKIAISEKKQKAEKNEQKTGNKKSLKENILERARAKIEKR